MKRILLTSIVKGYAKSFYSDLCNCNPEPTERLKLLKKQLQIDAYKEYVDTILQNYELIVTSSPKEFNTTIVPLFNSKQMSIDLAKMFTVHTQLSNGKSNVVRKKFYQLVVDALCYDEVQEMIFPKYMKQMGINTCVYCNCQYALSTKKGKTNKSKRYRSTYTIDHCLPKSYYPYLATSFFNLYPACSSCNQNKSFKSPIFNLYVEPTEPVEDRNPFCFSLEKSSFIKYSMTGNVDDLEIKFQSQDNKPQNCMDYDDYFHIEKLYENLKDVVEEVIWKSRVYNASGRKALEDSFSIMLHDKNDWNRFILGNYVKEEELFKRPLAKLVHDIAKQLGIL